MKFYNLIIANQPAQWDRNPSPFSNERILEYTDKYVEDMFVNDDGTLKDSVKELPTLLVNEFHNNISAKLVSIENLQVENKDTLIEFREIPLAPNIPIEVIQSISFELSIDRFEGNRTHWAIKNVDLISTLKRHGLIEPTHLGDGFFGVISDDMKSVDISIAATPTKTVKNKIFISYSHIDKDFLKRLKVHLKPLESQMDITFWDDAKITAGDQWLKEIEDALNASTAAILILSADFLASDFIMTKEVPPLLDALKSRGARIIPIIAKPCLFATHPELGKIQAINSPENSIIKMEEWEQEETYLKVAEVIQSTLE